MFGYGYYTHNSIPFNVDEVVSLIMSDFGIA
jgi:hypothetical protein